MEAVIPPDGVRHFEIDLAIDIAFDRGWNSALAEIGRQLQERAGNQTIKQVIRMIAEIKRGTGNG